jgi:(4S)-4-hydroxy-5-phosphonooxypentane-2,3-dione isomerase
MQALIVEFIVKPAFVEAFAVAIALNAKTSRESEPGCLQFDVCRDSANPQLFFLYELYNDEAAVQAHLNSAHFLQMNTATASWVQGKSVRRMQRTAPP